MKKLDIEVNDQAERLVPASDRAHPAPSLEVTSSRRLKKGFCSRKRIGLKINADLNAAPSTSILEKTKEGADAARDATDTPWWIMEYQCPPPGHLGAHSVDVPQPLSGEPGITTLEKQIHAETHTKTETQHRKISSIKEHIPSYISYSAYLRIVSYLRLILSAFFVEHSPGQKRKFGATEKEEMLSSPSTIAIKELKQCHLTNSCQMLETPPLNDKKSDLFPGITIITPTKGSKGHEEDEFRAADGSKSTQMARTI
uniref:AlNc14C206G8805 protein n=1 Tax=Albugo laibachii Nc14 TaxID=890382 RepID=F0WQZ7_9STRA|nr:AlNc14C206G8805 [Albugo laibachii Nc14]|eukprot:CCA23757.1 AlNc14C206G8805 [Albugo laibachii Nc14]